MDKNQKICECCGQITPFPTEPGLWEYCYNLSLTKSWRKVRIKQSPEGLEVWPVGEKKPIFWPEKSTWRKVKE